MVDAAERRVAVYKDNEIDVVLTANGADYLVRVMITPERVEGLLDVVPILRWDIGPHEGPLECAFTWAIEKAKEHIDAFPNVVREGYRKHECVVYPGTQLCNDGSYQALVQVWWHNPDNTVSNGGIKVFEPRFQTDAEAHAFAVTWAEGGNIPA